MIRQPSWSSVLLLLAGLAVFVTAARWQYGRALEKDDSARAFAAALAELDPPPLDAVDPADLAGERAFSAVRVAGTVDRTRVLMLDNQIQGGRTGVSVFAPVATDSGRVILVQFGWVAWPDRRVPPALPALPERIDSAGLLARPPSPGLIADSIGSGPYPRLVMSVEPTALAESWRLPGLPRQVFWPQADPASGFARDWQPPGIGAERHRGYALQWASFAVAAILLFLILHRKKPT